MLSTTYIYEVIIYRFLSKLKLNTALTDDDGDK
jgi:hypothetical protein